MLIAEISIAGKVKVSRAPSGRSSWRRQSLIVCGEEGLTGDTAISGSLKKAGGGDFRAVARDERLTASSLFSLHGSIFKTRRRSEGG